MHLNGIRSMRIKNYINGEFVESQSGSCESINPSHPSEVLADSPIGEPSEVETACDAAGNAQPGWAALAGPARGDYLYKWADAIAANSTAMAEALAKEVGKPIGEAKGEVGRCVAILRYYGAEAVRSRGDVIPSQFPGVLQYSYRQPLGAVALITPWNFPLAIPLWKAAPALAVGNTVVVKPAEFSPLCAHYLAETAKEAGLPSGVFNVAYGKGSVVGEALVNHPAIQGVSFTGSDRVGALISAACAARNIKCQTEMGGKNVGIVLGDADLAKAASLTASGAMRFAGQKCTATSRVVVDKSVYGEFIEELRTACAALPVGDAMDASTAVGPVISERDRDRIDETLESHSHEVLYQGERPGEGFFVAPTVYGGVDPDAELSQGEIFGPVLGVYEADGLDQAIEIANNTKFGLSAALYTRDINSAMRYIDRIEAGMVRVNGDTTGVDPHAPFGGFKGSSSHTREQGPAAMEFYTEYKTVQINP